MIFDLSANHLANKSFEPQRGNNALLRIFGIPGNFAGIRGESILTLSLNSFPLPTVTVEPMEIMFLNEKRKVAGTASFEAMDVTFKDFVDVGTAQLCKVWHEQVYNPVTGAIGLASVYKKPALIELFGPGGQFSRYYYIQGIWPSTFNPGTIDMTSAEPVLITLSLEYDKAYAAKGPKPASLIAAV